MYLPHPTTYHKVHSYSILSPETEIDYEIGRRRWNYLPFPSDDNTVFDCCYRLMGSCNGLICLASVVLGSQCAIHIWNPSLHEYITLPPFSVPCNEEENGDNLLLGFGFDATADDYKLVKLVYDCWRACWSKTEVYRVKKGCWEIINQVVPLAVLHIFGSADGLNFNGSVHWLAYLDNGRGETNIIIISFDLADETFGEISLPHSLPGIASCHCLKLCVLKRQLALFSFNHIPYRTHQFCDLWVMKVYGDHQSWFKEHAIRLDALPCVILSPIGFTPTGEFFLESAESNLISYDPKSEQVKDFGIPVSDATYYVESLVSIATESYGSGRRNSL